MLFNFTGVKYLETQSPYIMELEIILALKSRKFHLGYILLIMM